MTRWLAVLALLWGCTGGELGQEVVQQPEEDKDEEGPVIEHDPVSEPQVYGEDVLLEATVFDDDSGVATVQVYYRQETSVEFKSKGMSEVGGGLYQGSIKGHDVGSGGMVYYIEAVDWAQNTACLPEDCDEDAWHFTVVPAS